MEYELEVRGYLKPRVIKLNSIKSLSLLEDLEIFYGAKK